MPSLTKILLITRNLQEVTNQPANRNGSNDRTTEKRGVKHMEITLPVSSGRRSSIALPLAATIS